LEGINEPQKAEFINPVFTKNTMNNIFNDSLRILLAILISVLFFHLLILIKVIPYEITWGGRLQNDGEMYVFEAISILINAFMIWVLLMKGNYVKYQFPVSVLRIILWVFFFIFFLNTIGNLFAKTNFEKLFTLLTGIIALLVWKILRKKTA